ncbi:gluconate 2-dehydrogenase subunit 3 family protein [Pedobacter agri]|uniref:gluconate 2-dehydrogenase subunit 3 family protein n=1 Tax=Pedobacter agri TaxID=454586 RepID=UPI00292CD553|nr:gluconate 2-dehydrogenase subunit 3 family protein [Pedobacter agri]
MNRRKALKNLFVFSVFTSIGIGGYKFYKAKKEPLLASLNEYKDLIAEVANTIIPETDTPGAIGANVQDFIINVIKNCAPIQNQNNFISGLNDLEAYCQLNYQLGFCKCTLAQKIKTLNYFEEKEVSKFSVINKINNKLFGQPFISQFKTLTIQGYCMSYVGATKGLAYEYVPGSYIPCTPLKYNQKSWATK